MTMLRPRGRVPRDKEGGPGRRVCPGGWSRGTVPGDRTGRKEGRKALTGGESQAALDLDGQPLCSICEKRAALGEPASGWHDPTLCAFCNDEFSKDIRASYDEEHA